MLPMTVMGEFCPVQFRRAGLSSGLERYARSHFKLRYALQQVLLGQPYGQF
jgi:hypothetical protein